MGRHAMPRDAQKTAQRRRRITEAPEYVAMLKRTLLALGYRIGDDPAALAHLREIEAALRDSVNLGIYLANKGPARYSIVEQAAILGVTKQAVHKRVRLGEQVYLAIEAARAGGAVVRLADIRAARAAVLAGAGVADRAPARITGTA